MKVAVYTTQSWRVSAYFTTGVKPMTCPSVTAETLDIERLYAPIVYIRLHGMPSEPYLYGDPGIPTAITAKQIEEANFYGSHVFLEGCYGSLLANSFFIAGAESVTGSNTSTWGRSIFLGPSSIVGKNWLRLVRKSVHPSKAIAIARKTVKYPYRAGWSTKVRENEKQ